MVCVEGMVGVLTVGVGEDCVTAVLDGVAVPDVVVLVVSPLSPDESNDVVVVASVGRTVMPVVVVLATEGVTGSESTIDSRPPM